MRLWAAFIFFSPSLQTALPAQTPAQWRAAEHAIRRLPPEAFPQLPVAVRAVLVARGCTVPQSFTNSRPHNVVRGRFARARQLDWAVLCSRSDSSSILIFWGSDTGAPTQLGWRSDAGFLQGIGGGRIGYSHVIAVASPDRVRAAAASFTGPQPTHLDHDGVEDVFAEKASTVFYLEQGRWLSLVGAD